MFLHVLPQIKPFSTQLRIRESSDFKAFSKTRTLAFDNPAQLEECFLVAYICSDISKTAPSHLFADSWGATVVVTGLLLSTPGLAAPPGCSMSCRVKMWQPMNLQPLQVMLNKYQKLLSAICSSAAQKQKDTIHR